MKPALFLLISFFSITVFAQSQVKVSVDDEIKDFSLKTVHGKEIELNDLNVSNPVVLVILRGWPGYQCPICTRQVGGLIDAADKFKKYDAKVLMIYPGPSEELKNHAEEFSEDFDFPEHFYFTLDPDYSVINQLGLRWDAPKETAYPSTFVIGKNGKVVFAKVSETHGGRAEVGEILEALK